MLFGKDRKGGVWRMSRIQWLLAKAVDDEFFSLQEMEKLKASTHLALITGAAIGFQVGMKEVCKSVDSETKRLKDKYKGGWDSGG